MWQSFESFIEIRFLFLWKRKKKREETWCIWLNCSKFKKVYMINKSRWIFRLSYQKFIWYWKDDNTWMMISKSAKKTLIKNLNYDTWYSFNFSYEWWSRKFFFRNTSYSILKKSINKCWNFWVCKIFKTLKIKQDFEWVTE